MGAPGSLVEAEPEAKVRRDLRGGGPGFGGIGGGLTGVIFAGPEGESAGGAPDGDANDHDGLKGLNFHEIREEEVAERLGGRGRREGRESPHK